MATAAAHSPVQRGRWIGDAWAALRPPPRLALSTWADRHFRLSAESAAEPGRWRTRPYQRGILDAITDPSIERVSVRKSARVGYTQCMNAAIAYFMRQDPCPILIVQPTVDTAKIYSREQIAPMLRDVPILAGLVSDANVKTTGRTLLHKSFPGGVLAMVGANSGAGFRMVSRRVVIFDEVDGYPESAGDDGDPIKLGEKRAEAYWNRKIVAGSTPLIAGASRIDELFHAGDQRRFHVPCPHCGYLDFLSFDRKAVRGHTMHWPEDNPAAAYFVCRGCGEAITEEHKREMLEQGEWIADKPGGSHASFHIWTAYSTSPNASWGTIATEYLEAVKRPDTERTFVNTVLGEPFQLRGDAPEWLQLYQRREDYATGAVPVDPLVITCGVDVQKDRLFFEVVAWLGDKQSYSLEAGELEGDTALEATWRQADELLGRTFAGPDGTEHHIRMLAIDSSAFTQTVYGWAYGKPRVMAIKGNASAPLLVGAASPVDITVGGRKIQRGGQLWTVGVDLAKAELYGWLRIPEPGPGYCHFPRYDASFFKQLTAEYLATTTNKTTGRETRAWHVLPGRPNHYLDCRIYARAAAYVLGLDKYRAQTSRPTPELERDARQPDPAPQRGGWLGPRRGGWLR